MSRIKKGKWKSSIATKLVGTILLTIYIPTFICIYFVAQFLMHYEKENYVRAMDSSLVQVRASIEERFQLCQQTASILAHDSAITSFLETPIISEARMVQDTLQTMIPKTNNARLMNKYVSSIRLIHGDQDIVNAYNIIIYSDGFRNGDWKKRLAACYADISTSLGRVYVSSLEDENVYYQVTGTTPNEKVIHIYSPIYSTARNNLIGVVELSMEDEILAEPCSNITLKNGEIIQLIDYKNNVIFSSASEFLAPNTQEYSESNTPRLVTRGNIGYHAYYKHIDGINSWIALYIPQNVSGSNNYIFVIVAMSSISFLISILICLAIYKLFSSNIQILTNAINRVKTGDLNAKAIVKSGDEIQYLAEHFNDMTSRINILMQNIKTANETEREAIYKSLEIQMKPHFLCNALDFIRMSAELQNNTTISESIQLIMNYFNYNMNRRQHFVTLRDELANVKDFISIYNIINHDKIECTIDISADMAESLDNYTIIKYMLQPIVENALKHAFRNKNEDCSINVEISKTLNEDGTDDMISIGIEDNGEGMEPDACTALADSIKGDSAGIVIVDKSHNGVGLQNIYHRMRLVYMEKCDLRFESYPNVGTKVTVVIPAYRDKTG
jgi:two-component system, sensor histidine kinase YesM